MWLCTPGPKREDIGGDTAWDERAGVNARGWELRGSVRILRGLGALVPCPVCVTAKTHKESDAYILMLILGMLTLGMRIGYKFPSWNFPSVTCSGSEQVQRTCSFSDNRFCFQLSYAPKLSPPPIKWWLRLHRSPALLSEQSSLYLHLLLR